MTMDEVIRYSERNGFATRNEADDFENKMRLSFTNKEETIRVIMRPEYTDTGKIYEKPEISWSSIGSKSIEIAREFSHDMTIALNIAEYLELMIE